MPEEVTNVPQYQPLQCTAPGAEEEERIRRSKARRRLVVAGFYHLDKAWSDILVQRVLDGWDPLERDSDPSDLSDDEGQHDLESFESNPMPGANGPDALIVGDAALASHQRSDASTVQGQQASSSGMVRASLGRCRF